MWSNKIVSHGIMLPEIFNHCVTCHIGTNLDFDRQCCTEDADLVEDFAEDNENCTLHSEHSPLANE